MQKKAQRLWAAIVDVAKAGEQLAFVENIVKDLAEVFQQTTKLPERRQVRIENDDGAFISLSVYPVGDIGEKLVKLSELLTDPNDRDAFYVTAANFVDVQPDDVSADRNVPPKPGLLLSVNGRPALIIGGEPQRLVLKMEGFERAVFGLSAEVPGLWENVRRAQGRIVEKDSRRDEFIGPRIRNAVRVEGNVLRREGIQHRLEKASPAGQLGLTLPALTIRPIEVSGDAVANLGGDALLVPVRGTKIRPGAYPTRPAVEMLREALGVQTILADESLRTLLDDARRAEELLERVLPKAYRHMRDIGRKNLSYWTGFDGERDVKVWAAAKYAGVVRARREGGMAAEIEAALAPVELLGRALNHAERIAPAHDFAESVDVEQARDIIEEAYEKSRHSDLGSNALFDIAVYGDINPSMLWSVPNEAVVEILEAARVLGRVRAGARTVMSPAVQRVVYDGLFGIIQPRDRNEDLIALRNRAAAGFAELLGADRLRRMLGLVEDRGEHVLIERKNRRMKAISSEKAFKIASQRRK